MPTKKTSKREKRIAQTNRTEPNPSEPNSAESNSTETTPTKLNSLKRPKEQVTPLEYLQLNNPQMFAKNMFSQGKVISMNTNNLTRHRKERKKHSYHQVISNLIKNDIIEAKTNKNIIDKLLQVDKKYYCSDQELNDCYNNDNETSASTGIPTTQMLAHACYFCNTN